MTEPLQINPDHATETLRCDYAHVGLFDTTAWQPWIARPGLETEPLAMAHAALLRGGSAERSVLEKDRYLCYWYHTPHSGGGLVHGYPIEWEEGHLLVRLDPRWDHRNQTMLKSTDTRRIERNIEQQYQWGRRIYTMYLELEPGGPLSWHLIGPRPTDSMFYIERYEPG